MASPGRVLRAVLLSLSDLSGPSNEIPIRIHTVRAGRCRVRLGCLGGDVAICPGLYRHLWPEHPLIRGLASRPATHGT